MSALEWALRYAAAGIPVLPCREDKNPATTHGFYDATTDVDTITACWTKNPEAKIGGYLGAVGMFAVDVDVKDGKRGDDQLRDLEQAHGDLPDTVTVLTPSGGEHRWFKMNGTRIGSHNGQPWGDAIDIKGIGGYVILPGTPGYTFDTEHDFLDGAPVADAPGWLTAICPKPEGPGGSGSWRHLTDDGRALLDPATAESLRLLEQLGAHSPILYRREGGEPYVQVTRPGKRHSTSATVGYIGPGVVKVWSSNWPRLPAGRYDADDLHWVATSNGHPDDNKTTDNTDEQDDDYIASWRPVDLGPALRGEKTTPQATVLQRGDGRYLLHPASVNWLFGDSGIGKTFVATQAIREELAAGHNVLMLDYEADDVLLVGRLLGMAVPRDHIERHLIYIHPDSGATFDAVTHIVNLCHEHDVTLVVVDSVGEAFGVESIDENKDVEVGPWVRRVLRRIADAGPCVAVVDHSTKAGDNPLHPSGSKRKRAAITGAGYLVEAVTPFSRDQSGLLRLTCAKDRHGHFARGECAALVRVEPYPDGGIGISVEAPPQPKDAREAASERIVDVVRDVVATLKGAGAPLSGRELLGKLTVKARVQIQRAGIDAAARVGAIKIDPGARQAHLHRWVRDLTDADFERLR